VAQDEALSRLKPGFEFPWGHLSIDTVYRSRVLSPVLDVQQKIPASGDFLLVDVSWREVGVEISIFRFLHKGYAQVR